MRSEDAFLLAVVHVLPDPVVGIDGQGRVRTWNTGASRAFGYSEDDAYGLRFDEICSGGVVRAKDGSVVVVAPEAVPLDATGSQELQVQALWILRPVPHPTAEPAAEPAAPVSGGIAALADLPPRQREVLAALCTGKSEKEIASALHLSPHTVHGHIKALYRRCGVQSRAALVARVLGHRGGHLS